MIGIYQITCNPSKKSYIGSSKNIERRIETHFYDLERGKHHSYKLQAEFDKYGRHAFSWCVLIECTTDQLFEMEKKYVETKRPALNVAPVNNIPAGAFSKELQDEIRKKQSIAHKGKKLGPMPESQKKSISLAKLGKKTGKATFKRKHTEDEKARIRAKLIGKKFSKEHSEKLSKANVLRGKRRRLAAWTSILPQWLVDLIIDI